MAAETGKSYACSLWVLIPLCWAVHHKDSAQLCCRLCCISFLLLQYQIATNLVDEWINENRYSITQHIILQFYMSNLTWVSLSSNQSINWDVLLSGSSLGDLFLCIFQPQKPPTFLGMWHLPLSSKWLNPFYITSLWPSVYHHISFWPQLKKVFCF